MQSSNTAGEITPAFSKLSLINELAAQLAESQLVPEPLRNKSDCLAIFLTADSTGKCPMVVMQEFADRIAQPKPNKFASLAMILCQVETPAQLQEAVRLMDEVTAGKCVTEDEAKALLTICQGRYRALGVLGEEIN